MTAISIKQIEAFVQVADQASFRGAATALNTTQPNISSRIASLEAQLDQKLMSRDAGSVCLTVAGQQLLPKARRILQAMDEFIAGAGACGLFDGVLQLGVTEVIVHTWLSSFLSQLRARFPNVSIDLTVDLSSNLSDALFNRAIDLAFHSGPFTKQTTGSIQLAEYPLVWVASPDLDLGNESLNLAQLTHNPILTHARQTLPFKQLYQHISTQKNAKLVPSTNLAACLRMTLEGLGIACLPQVMVAADLESGKLEQLNYHWHPDELKFFARYHHDSAPHFVQQAAQLAALVAAGVAATATIA